MKIKKKYQMLLLSFIIAIVIWVTSILSMFSVQMFLISQDATHVVWSFLINVMTILVMMVLIWFGIEKIPIFRRAVAQVFSLEEENKPNKKTPAKKPAQYPQKSD